MFGTLGALNFKEVIRYRLDPEQVSYRFGFPFPCEVWNEETWKGPSLNGPLGLIPRGGAFEFETVLWFPNILIAVGLLSATWLGWDWLSRHHSTDSKQVTYRTNKTCLILSQAGLLYLAVTGHHGSADTRLIIHNRSGSPIDSATLLVINSEGVESDRIFPSLNIGQHANADLSSDVWTKIRFRLKDSEIERDIGYIEGRFPEILNLIIDPNGDLLRE